MKKACVAEVVQSPKSKVQSLPDGRKVQSLDDPIEALEVDLDGITDVTELADLGEALDILKKQAEERLSVINERLARSTGGRPGDTLWVPGSGLVGAQCVFPKAGLAREFFFRGDIACRKKGDEVVDIGPLKAMAGPHFKTLFFAFYKPAKAFNDLAKRLLPAEPAAELIQVMTVEPGSPRVSYKQMPKTS